MRFPSAAGPRSLDLRGLISPLHARIPSSESGPNFEDCSAPAGALGLERRYLDCVMKVVLAAGTGSIGRLLARALAERGAEVVILSRSPRPLRYRAVPWNAKTFGDWAGELEGAHAVINLAGAPINCRFTPQNRRLLYESRVDSARVIGEAIRQCSSPPRVWLQAGAANLYSPNPDRPCDEDSPLDDLSSTRLPDAWRFAARLAIDWERACADSDTPNTRKVILRTTLALTPERGGVFDVLLGLVRRGLGGTQGRGNQFVSWIHHRDFAGAVLHILDRESIEGPVNMSSPHPLPNAEFMRVLRQSWGIRLGLPAPAPFLAFGARLLGTETELILKSRRVLPKRLIESGYGFEFSSWSEAAADLSGAWRALRKERA